jgi:hypothetical protein
MIHQAAPTILRENATALQCLWGILPISPRKRGTHGHGATSSAREWIGAGASDWSNELDTRHREKVAFETWNQHDSGWLWELKTNKTETSATNEDLRVPANILMKWIPKIEFHWSPFFCRNHWVVTPLKELLIRNPPLGWLRTSQVKSIANPPNLPDLWSVVGPLCHPQLMDE